MSPIAALHGATKRCTKCKIEKTTDNFYRNSSSPDGFAWRCKSCDRNLGIAMRERHRNSEPVIPETKKCCRCKKVLPIGSFTKLSSSKDGHRCDCKACNNAKQTKYRREYPEKVRISKKRAYSKWKKNQTEADRKKKRKYHRTHKLKTKYGITLAQFNWLLEKQKFLCAICSKKIDPDSRQTAIDHDHETGEIRGILCRSCNRGLGLLGDTKQSIKEAHNYLCKPPVEFPIIKEEK